jgi:hypothetical protein
MNGRTHPHELSDDDDDDDFEAALARPRAPAAPQVRPACRAKKCVLSKEMEDARSGPPGAPAFAQATGVSHDSSPRVVVLGFASRATRGRLQAPMSTTPCPSSPLTRGLRETFSATPEKRAAEAPQEAPRSGADSGADSGAAGASSGDEQEQGPRQPAGLERTLSGSTPVCIPGGDRRRYALPRHHHACLAPGFSVPSVRRRAARPQPPSARCARRRLAAALGPPRARCGAEMRAPLPTRVPNDFGLLPACVHTPLTVPRDPARIAGYRTSWPSSAALAASSGRCEPPAALVQEPCPCTLHRVGSTAAPAQ